MPQYIVFDVGGTNLKYALMNENAEILAKGEFPTPMDKGKEGFLEAVKAVYDKYADKAEAIAMSAPGKIDSSRGYFYTSGALKYLNGVDLPAELKKFVPLPVSVENDGKSAALAELWKGSLQGVSNGVVIVLGTGIGGGIIIDGKLYRGHTFAAGEFSGLPVHLDEFPMNLGHMWATQNGVGYMAADYAERIGADPAKMNGRILFDAANKGDQNALGAIDHYCEGLAAGIVSLQFVLDTEKVAIGGGISKQPLLLETLQKKLHEYYDKYAGFMPATLPEVVSCTFGNDANLIGALYHYLYELKK